MLPQERAPESPGEFVSKAIGSDDFDSKVNSSLTALLMKVVGPWFNDCFNKYSDYEFHSKMASGFSFIQDFRVNHSGGWDEYGNKRDKKYLNFIKVGRLMNKPPFNIRLDEEQVLASIIGLLSSRDWILYEEEVARMRNDLLEIRAEIER